MNTIQGFRSFQHPDWTALEIEAFCQMNDLQDGIHRHDDGTYWWYDETGSDENGPYTTREEAALWLARYGSWL